jgi:hypothetical protein
MSEPIPFPRTISRHPTVANTAATSRPVVDDMKPCRDEPGFDTPIHCAAWVMDGSRLVQ